jgi:hypothetical protein
MSTFPLKIAPSRIPKKLLVPVLEQYSSDVSLLQAETNTEGG